MRNATEDDELFSFDIELLIKELADKKNKKEGIEFDGTLARVENCVFDEKNGLWQIRILKLRDTNIPSIVKESEEAIPIKLEENEYIGEDLTMIIDVRNNIAMIQNNRFSISISRLEKMFTKIFSNPKERVVISPILDIIDISKINKKYYKSIQLRFADISNHSAVPNSSLGGIFSAYNQMGGVSGTISISIGRSKEKTLIAKSVKSLLGDISSNKDIITGAILKVKDDDDSNIEVINLFENIYSNFIEYSLEERATLGFEYCIDKMTEKFLDNRGRVLLTIRNEDEIN
jgi:hypothetical protein